MKEGFQIVWRQLVRGWMLACVLAAVGAIWRWLPGLVRSDGTVAGEAEMFVRSVSGAVYAVVAVAVLVIACGLVARERVAMRLALVRVRPVSAFAFLLGAYGALVAFAACPLALDCALVCARAGKPLRAEGVSAVCRHRFLPVMPSAEHVAAELYESYLADPATPEAVRKAPKRTVLNLLAGKEKDRFDTIAPGASATWNFPAAAQAADAAVRVRFTTTYETRADLRGTFALGACSAVVSNSTQAVLEVPMKNPTSSALTFTNAGKAPVMVRPRADVEVLTPADSQMANALRAHLEMLAVVALLGAVGIFLSAALSRPVAIFTALVALVAALLAPEATADFSETLEMAWADRVAFALSNGVTAVAGCVSRFSPVSTCAGGICVEMREVACALLLNMVLLPLVFISAGAVVARKKGPDYE